MHSLSMFIPFMPINYEFTQPKTSTEASFEISFKKKYSYDDLKSEMLKINNIRITTSDGNEDYYLYMFRKLFDDYKSYKNVLDYVEYLVYNSIKNNINEKNKYDKTILMYVCLYGFTEYIELLVSHNADIYIQDNEKFTATHYSIQSYPNKYVSFENFDYSIVAKPT